MDGPTVRKLRCRGQYYVVDRRERCDVRGEWRAIDSKFLLENMDKSYAIRKLGDKVLCCEHPENLLWCPYDRCYYAILVGAGAFRYFWSFHWYYPSKQGVNSEIRLKSLRGVSWFDYMHGLYQSGAKKNRPRSMKNILSGYLFKVDRMIAKMDEKYCPVEQERKIVNEDTWREPDVAIDEECYQRFKRYMNLKVNEQRERSFSGESWSMHGVRAEQIPDIVAALKGDKFLRWEDLDGPFGYARVVRGPKTDGVCRDVFPMTMRTNAFITQMFDNQEPILPENCEIVYGNRFPSWRYTYDVKNCDVQIYPYFKRLLQEVVPEHVDKILGKVIYKGKRLNLPQFPSGVCVFMKYINAVFTAALLNLEFYDSIRFKLQGDGCMAEFSIRYDHDLVRKNPDFVINGFSYANDDCKFMNGIKKLTTPRLRDSWLHGELRWKVHKWIYENVLNSGKLDIKHFLNEWDDNDLSEIDVLRFLSDNFYMWKKCDDFLKTWEEKSIVSESFKKVFRRMREERADKLMRRESICADIWHGADVVGYMA